MGDQRHDVYMIIGRDGRPTGVVCRKCNRVAWWDKDFDDCAQADADTMKQLGEQCTGGGKRCTSSV